MSLGMDDWSVEYHEELERRKTSLGWGDMPDAGRIRTVKFKKAGEKKIFHGDWTNADYKITFKGITFESGSENTCKIGSATYDDGTLFERIKERSGSGDTPWAWFEINRTVFSSGSRYGEKVMIGLMNRPKPKTYEEALGEYERLQDSSITFDKSAGTLALLLFESNKSFPDVPMVVAYAAISPKIKAGFFDRLLGKKPATSYEVELNISECRYEPPLKPGN